MSIHEEASPLAGQTVTIKGGEFAGLEYVVEDWWDRVSGGSWMFATGNPACLEYAIRSGFSGTTPTDDEVLYGKIGAFGKLIHVSDLTSEEV